MNSLSESDPFTHIAIEIAGFMWPPEIPPAKSITKVSVPPIAKALPVAKTDIKSKNVPKNSTSSTNMSILLFCIIFRQTLTSPVAMAQEHVSEDYSHPESPPE